MREGPDGGRSVRTSEVTSAIRSHCLLRMPLPGTVVRGERRHVELADRARLRSRDALHRSDGVAQVALSRRGTYPLRGGMNAAVKLRDAFAAADAQILELHRLGARAIHRLGGKRGGYDHHRGGQHESVANETGNVATH